MVVQTGIRNRKPGFDTQIEGFPASSYVPNKANLLNQKLRVFPVNVLCEIARFDHVWWLNPHRWCLKNHVPILFPWFSHHFPRFGDVPMAFASPSCSHSLATPQLAMAAVKAGAVGAGSSPKSRRAVAAAAPPWAPQAWGNAGPTEGMRCV